MGVIPSCWEDHFSTNQALCFSIFPFVINSVLYIHLHPTNFFLEGRCTRRHVLFFINEAYSTDISFLSLRFIFSLIIGIWGPYMANNLIIRENWDLVQWLSEGMPILEPANSRVFQAQTGREIVVGTILDSSKHSIGSLEQEGELGWIVEPKVDEWVTYIGVIKGEGKFKVTWGTTN